MSKIRNIYEYLNEINFEERVKQKVAHIQRVRNHENFNYIVCDFVMLQFAFSLVRDLFDKIVNDIEGNEMKLKVKYYNPDLPELTTRDGDSGFDLRASIDNPVQIPPHHRATVGTGVAVEFCNQSYLPSCSAELQVRPRSGHTMKGIVAQFGTIDLAYRGEIKITLFNFSDETVTIEPFERIAQLVVCPIYKPIVETADQLTPTKRGEQGFGSTGKN